MGGGGNGDVFLEHGGAHMKRLPVLLLFLALSGCDDSHDRTSFSLPLPCTDKDNDVRCSVPEPTPSPTPLPEHKLGDHDRDPDRGEGDD